jgi:transposase
MEVQSMKGHIVLSRKEIHRGHVLEQVAQRTLTLKEAAKIMGISYRQAKRVRKRWQEGGLEALCHGNRGRRVSHALTDSDAAVIVALHEHVYKNFNDTHFAEMLAENEGIVLSREKVRQILRAAGREPKRKRRTKKRHARRPRKSQAGIMMQWDGSPHRWFGPGQQPCCLMCSIDDAQSTVLGAVFVPAESSLGYLRLLDMVVRRHGAPLSVYQDRHTALTRSDDFWSIEEQLQGEQYPTHVGRVLQDLGIRAISALSPQAKGRIERGFGILQDRLIAELELEGITDMDAANRWLEECFIGRYNERFGIQAEEPGGAFVKVSKAERYDKIVFAYEATVGNDNCVRLGGLAIDVPPARNRPSFAKARVLVKQHLDGRWSVDYHGKIIARHDATPLNEPVRSWKRRQRGVLKRGRSMTQVYISSKPAPPP